MLLAIDVGNTNIVVGVLDGDRLAPWSIRINGDALLGEDHFAILEESNRTPLEHAR